MPLLSRFLNCQLILQVFLNIKKHYIDTFSIDDSFCEHKLRVLTRNNNYPCRNRLLMLCYGNSLIIKWASVESRRKGNLANPSTTRKLSFAPMQSEALRSLCTICSLKATQTTTASSTRSTSPGCSRSTRSDPKRALWAPSQQLGELRGDLHAL
jgi:hypothetical protein